MQYMGGKEGISKKLAAFLSEKATGKHYWEPFMGGLSVLAKIRGGLSRWGSDAVPLESLYNGVLEGWVPPDVVSEEDYRNAKMLPEQHPLSLFCRFGVSFGGKSWGGYARGGDSNYALIAKNSLLKKLSTCKDVCFFQGDYRAWLPPMPAVIYCDPPYRNTTGYSTGKFDFETFYLWCVETTKKGYKVFVSEETMPSPFRIVWEAPKRRGLRSSDGTMSVRMERVYEVGE